MGRDGVYLCAGVCACMQVCVCKSARLGEQQGMASQAHGSHGECLEAREAVACSSNHLWLGVCEAGLCPWVG